MVCPSSRHHSHNDTAIKAYAKAPADLAMLAASPCAAGQLLAAPSLVQIGKLKGSNNEEHKANFKKDKRCDKDDLTPEQPNAIERGTPRVRILGEASTKPQIA